MSIERWLGRLSPSTAKNSLIWFKNFQRWMKENGGKFSEMSPDEWVEFQKNCTNGERFDFLDTLRAQRRSLRLKVH